MMITRNEILGHKTKLQFHLSFLTNLILSHAEELFCVSTYFCFAFWISIFIYRKLVYWQLPNPICWQKDAVHLCDLRTAACVQCLRDAKWCVLILHLLKPNRAPNIIQVMCITAASAYTKQGSKDQPGLKKKISPTPSSLLHPSCTFFGWFYLMDIFFALV